MARARTANAMCVLLMSRSLSDLRKEIETIKESLLRVNDQHLTHKEGFGLEIKSSPQNKIYMPTPTGHAFHANDEFVKMIVGPYGSGKSTMCCQEIVMRACAMPYWKGNRRRSKWALVRNTSGELESTTLQTWLSWFGEMGDVVKRKKPIMIYEHTFNDGEGIVELELIFLALDREDDLRKIRSLELTGCYINELSEVPQGALSHFKGRIGRYPSKAFCKDPYWSGIIADSNPTDHDHWLYKGFEEKSQPGHQIFHQPPGLLKDDNDAWVRNPDADNANNLPNDYYVRMSQGQTQDFIKVFCLGEYGSVGFGKKVYPEYNDDLHSVEYIEPDHMSPIHLGWDFGLTPACVVVQFTSRGQFKIVKEYTAEDMGIKTFAESIVLPGLQSDFRGCKIGVSVADPAGLQRDQIMEELSAIGVLNTLGIVTQGARTNDIEPRIGSVRYFMNMLVDGRPAFLVSRKGAPLTRRGFVKDYCYKRVNVPGEERYRDTPDKNMASHPQDAIQYIALEFAADRISEEKRPKSTVNMFNPTFRYL